METPVVDMRTLKSYLATGNAGPLGRPIAKLTFLLDDNSWPTVPDNFKRTNLFIHLLVGVVVFMAFRLMLRFSFKSRAAEWVALLVTAFFLLHPLQVSTAMYVVQRMTQLAGLFVMLGVGAHVYWRIKFPSIGAQEIVVISLTQAIFGCLAIFSKESGVLLPVYLLVVEATLLSGVYAGRLYRHWIKVCLLLPTLVIISYILYLPRWLSSYSSRDFTFVERVLTEPVILMDYLRSIITMRVYGLGLFQDDYPVYSELLSPKPLLSIIFLLGALILAVIYRKRFPVVCFGVLWFFAGHLLESTTISLELYFEHRNYIPMLGPVLALMYLSYCFFQRISENLGKFTPWIAVWLLGVAAMSTHGYARDWGELDRIIPIWSIEHPDSLRAQRSYAHLLAVRGLPEAALDALDEAYKLGPHDLSLPIMSLDIACHYDLPRRYSPLDLAERVSEHRFTDGLRVAINEYASKLLDTSCAADSESVHALLKVLPNVQKINPHSSLVAVFALLDGELYYREKRWMPALSEFFHVDRLKPTVSSALRLSSVYIFMQDYILAREFLTLARERNSRRGKFRYSYTDEEFNEKFDMIALFERHSVIGSE